jgi:hypothetical protein
VWLPELQRVVGVINTSFGANFSQIGCAGEVALGTHEDYDKFSIQVRARVWRGWLVVVVVVGVKRTGCVQLAAAAGGRSNFATTYYTTHATTHLTDSSQVS